MTISMLRYCFTYFGKEYVFRDKLLYRLPYMKDNRYYNERIITKQKNGYYLDKCYVSFESIKLILQQKQFTEIINTLPF